MSQATIKELIKILNKEYKEYINKPNVKITMFQYRPVKVYIDGEVEYPGLHVLNGSSSPQDLVSPVVENIFSVEDFERSRKSILSQYKSNLPSSTNDNLYFLL